MIPSLLIPLLIALGLAVVVTATHRRLPPVVAAHTVTIALAVVAFAAVPTFWIVSLGYVAHLPVFGGRLDWCANAFGVHEPIRFWVGAPALVLAIAGILRAWAVVNNYRCLRHDHPGVVEIANHHTPFAFTLPGRGGHVVLSTGLVAILDDAERAVVLAHEHAHGRHRHDRFLLTAQLTAAVMPPLRPLASRLQFSLERWADEMTVAHCGDRGLVARTLGKVALHGVSPAGAMSFAGLGVPARVAALLSPPMLPLRSGVHAALWAAITLTGIIAAFQIHHLLGLLTALCPT
ncbi:MAG: M48 family metalloprotease [Actinobacteria bacterium]|nr:M48 family metalloprotease [Actinomycetota bacterium]